MRTRILAMIRKEFIQVGRDRRTLAMIIAIPVLWLVAFGYAVTFDVQHVPTIVVDQAHTPASRALLTAVRDSDTFSVVDTGAAVDATGLRKEIQQGKASAALLIPAGYGVIGSHAAVQVLIDGSDLFGAQSVLRAAQTILQAAEVRQEQQLAASSGLSGVGAPTLAVATPQFDILYNAQLKSSYVMIPGLIGLVLVFIATIMTALGVVRERERGTLEQLIVTPLRPIELMLGKVLPYVVISTIDFILVVVLGLTLFSVPLRGSFLLLTVASLFFLLAALGLGLLISTVSQNQQQAMQLAIFTLLPQIIFSGFIFPLAAIPWGVRWIGYLTPLTYLVPVTRGVFLKAQGWSELWPNIAVLAVYGFVVLGLAAARFQKRLA